MEFGIFDQNDHSGRDLAQQYQERLALGQLYEESGFHCYHMSEHHGTLLSTTPSPSVFLSAMSQRTSRIRLGPLVYLLPGYNPLRLVEEIGMLDTLSNGRFQFGIGRGASPHEMGYLGVGQDTVRSMFDEALEIIISGMKNGVVDFSGEHWKYDNIRLSVTPIQRPHPPIWMAVGSPDSTVSPARIGANIMVGAPAERARAVFRRYLDEIDAAALPAGFEPLLGLNRYVIVAETDAEAAALAARAWDVFYTNFIALWRRHGGAPANRLPEDFEQLRVSGSAVVGSPATVLAQLSQQIETSGSNYLCGTFVFGDMTDEEARSSINLFARHVMQPLRDRSGAAHTRLREAA